MKLVDLVGLALVVLGLSFGQILFKLAGRSLAQSEGLFQGLLSPYLFAALAVYGLVTLLWVWRLSTADLSSSYSVIALTFVIVPLLSVVMLSEVVAPRYWLGVALIIVGIIITRFGF
jgi:drug/metabolite transporter (DMT)-like permease